MNEDYTSVQEVYEEKQSIGLAVASFVLGVLSLLIFSLGINLEIGVVAIILGAIFIRRNKGCRGKGLAWLGIGFSILSVGLFIWAVLMLSANKNATRVINDFTNDNRVIIEQQEDLFPDFEDKTDYEL